VKEVPPTREERGANASLTCTPGVRVTLQHLQGGATQLTRYAIDIGDFGICILT